MTYFPQVIRTDERNRERVYDLPSCLLQDRIILIDSEINSSLATSIIAQLLYLESENNEAPITIVKGQITACGFVTFVNRIKVFELRIW